VQFLLLHKANLYAQNDNGQMPIHLAIQRGHRQVVRLLIGADRTQSQVENGLGETPLQLAAMNGHRGIVMDLLNAGALATPEAVRVATHFGHNDIAKILTDYQGP
jgi:ankyrin repeat protein